MAYHWFKTQYPGVRYREHKTRRFSGKPDRYYTIYYKLNGKLKEEGLGWSSEEWNAQKASIQLAELKKAQTTGEGAVTLQEKRDIAEQARQKELEKRSAEEKAKVTFLEISGKYLEWAKTNKKTWKDDETRINRHIIPVIGTLPFSQIDTPDVEIVKTTCQSKKLSPKTVSLCLGLIREIYYFAIKQKLFKGMNPVKGVKFPKVDNRRMRFLSRGEAEALLTLAGTYNMELHDMC
ncbi:MAG: site-specific integrase, partial [Syntrophobacter sp.]